MAKPNITEVGRVTVPSADQDRSLAFYTETLGFEKRVDETFARRILADVAEQRLYRLLGVGPRRPRLIRIDWRCEIFRARIVRGNVRLVRWRSGP